MLLVQFIQGGLYELPSFQLILGSGPVSGVCHCIQRKLAISLSLPLLQPIEAQVDANSDQIGLKARSSLESGHGTVEAYEGELTHLLRLMLVAQHGHGGGCDRGLVPFYQRCKAGFVPAKRTRDQLMVRDAFQNLGSKYWTEDGSVLFHGVTSNPFLPVSYCSYYTSFGQIRRRTEEKV